MEISFAESEVEEAVVEEAVPASQVERAAWIKGKLPGSFETEGIWVWAVDMARNGVASHTDKEDKNAHSFKTDAAVTIDKDSKITQYIFLDPDDTPAGIMMKFLLKDGDEISAYWEGDEEVFAYTDEYISAWYMGPMPSAGTWIKIGIDCGELDIEETELIGVSFIANDGKLWWGETIVENQGGGNVEKKTQRQAEVAQQKSE